MEIMHELSIALSILEVAEEEAGKHGNVRVLEVRLKLGWLSGVVKEALESAFQLAREGTPFAETRLVIEEVPILVNCATCLGERGVVSMQEMCCVECGTPCPDVVSGRDLEVVAMEIQ